MEQYLSLLKASLSPGQIFKEAQDWQKVPIRVRLGFALTMLPWILPFFALAWFAFNPDTMILGIVGFALFALFVTQPYTRWKSQKIVQKYVYKKEK